MRYFLISLLWYLCIEPLLAQVGFIDHEGYVVIEPKYKNALPFSEGLAVVETVKGYKQFIDANGNVFIKKKFYDAKSFCEGLAPVLEKKEFGWGVINKQGQYVLMPNKAIVSIESYREGLAAYTEIVNSVFLSGYLNNSGKKYIEPIYEETKSFSEGYGAVKIKNKWGFINKYNTLIIQPQYDVVNEFHEGFCCVGNYNSLSKSYDLFIIDKFNTIIIDIQKHIANVRDEGSVLKYLPLIPGDIIFSEGILFFNITEHHSELMDYEGNYTYQNYALENNIITKYKFSNNSQTVLKEGIILTDTSWNYLFGNKYYYLFNADGISVGDGDILSISNFNEGYAVIKIENKNVNLKHRYLRLGNNLFQYYQNNFKLTK